MAALPASGHAHLLFPYRTDLKGLPALEVAEPGVRAALRTEERVFHRLHINPQEGTHHLLPIYGFPSVSCWVAEGQGSVSPRWHRRMEKVNFQGENSTRHVCLLHADHLAAGAELLAFSALTHPYGTRGAVPPPCFVGLLPFAPPPYFSGGSVGEADLHVLQGRGGAAVPAGRPVGAGGAPIWPCVPWGAVGEAGGCFPSPTPPLLCVSCSGLLVAAGFLSVVGGDCGLK